MEKITSVNSGRRDAFKNTLRTARGSTHKKLFFLLCRFLMFFVGVLLLWDCLFWLVLPYIFRFWPLLTPFRQKYSWKICRSDTLQVALQETCRMSAKKSDWLYKFHGKIAVHTSVARVTACEEPARKWDRRQKIGISQSNPLNRALIKNRPKQVKIQISREVQGFLKIFRV